MSLEKIALGTAQLGLEYGVANISGRPQREEAFSILDLACKEGIDTFDTAPAYGGSEEMIGEFFSGRVGNFKIISKLPSVQDGAKIDRCFFETLKKLKQDRIFGYLVHRFEDLRKHEWLWDRLEAFKQKRWVSKIGVSLYTPKELEYLLDKKINVDLVQVPFSIFDQRFGEYFGVLKSRGVAIHARSAFLQGLFFLNQKKIREKFPGAEESMTQLRGLSSQHSIPIHHLCLGFVALNDFIDKIIIGVDSLAQLENNIRSMGVFDCVKKIYPLLQSLKLDDERILLPYNWS